MANPKKPAAPTNALDGEDVRVREQDGQLKAEIRDEHGRLLYWARRAFDYGEEPLDRGQIVALLGLVNDKKLDRLGYIVALRRSDEVFPCRYCAAKFVDLNTLNAHGAKRHHDKDRRPDVPFSPRGVTVDENAAETQAFEREQKQLDQIAPLNLDKTEASRGARA
jgi:hypothetical protein